MVDAAVLEARRQQRQQVRSACLVWAVVLGTIATFILGYNAFGMWLERATIGWSGRPVIMFTRVKYSTEALLFIGLVTMIALVAALNVQTTARAIRNLAIVITMSCLSVYFTCYRAFLGLRPAQGSMIELVYLWPRPSVLLDARRIRFSVEWEADPADSPGLVQCITLFTAGRTIRAACGGNDAAASDLLRARGAVKVR